MFETRKQTVYQHQQGFSAAHLLLSPPPSLLQHCQWVSGPLRFRFNVSLGESAQRPSGGWVGKVVHWVCGVWRSQVTSAEDVHSVESHHRQSGAERPSAESCCTSCAGTHTHTHNETMKSLVILCLSHLQRFCIDWYCH